MALERLLHKSQGSRFVAASGHIVLQDPACMIDCAPDIYIISPFTFT
jgi:hypothetical protein